MLRPQPHAVLKARPEFQWPSVSGSFFLQYPDAEALPWRDDGWTMITVLEPSKDPTYRHYPHYREKWRKALGRDQTAIVYDGPTLSPGVQYMVVCEIELHYSYGEPTDPVRKQWWVTGVIPPTPFTIQEP